jgi:integrator complex subunit 4
LHALQLGTASGSKAEFNSRQLSASLTLIISAPLSNKQSITSIPPLAFSYSLAMLGKFSSGLHDMMDQDMLLAYLTHCAILSSSSGTEFNKGDVFFHAYRDSNADLAGNPVLLPGKDIPAESKYMACKAELEIGNQALKFVNHILLKIKAAWLLSQSGCSKEALRALRFYSLQSIDFPASVLLFHVYSKLMCFLSSCPGLANRS